MSSKWSDDLEAVARAFLNYVRANGTAGTWVRGIEAFNAAIEQCADQGWVRYTRANPKGHVAITAVIDQLMRIEFPDIEREKRGTAQSAPVFFRVKLTAAPRQPMPEAQNDRRTDQRIHRMIAQLGSRVRPHLNLPAPKRHHRRRKRKTFLQVPSFNTRTDCPASPPHAGPLGIATDSVSSTVREAAEELGQREANPWLLTPSSSPFVLQCDRDAVERFNARATGAFRIQTDLLPEPFVGRPDAPVVLLLLNPGVAGNEFVLHRQPDFRQRVQCCLRHEQTDYPNFYLDPRVRGNGADWHQRIFKPLIADFGAKAVANAVLDLEYFPYHSKHFDHGRIRVPSQAYTLELLRAAIRRDAIILLSRGRSIWAAAVTELRTHSKVFYSSSPRNAVISRGNYPFGYSVVCSAVKLCG